MLFETWPYFPGSSQTSGSSGCLLQSPRRWDYSNQTRATALFLSAHPSLPSSQPPSSQFPCHPLVWLLCESGRAVSVCLYPVYFS
jgi:hypothetical protein